MCACDERFVFTYWGCLRLNQVRWGGICSGGTIPGDALLTNCVRLSYHAPPDILRTCIRNSAALRSITLDFSSLRLSGAPPQVCGSAFLRWVAGQCLSTPMTSALPVADPEHGHCGVRGGAGVAARVLCDDPGPATWTSTGTGLAVSDRSCTWGANGRRKATVFPRVSGHQQPTELTPTLSFCPSPSSLQMDPDDQPAHLPGPAIPDL